jgi:glycosyltransferase involved in cell wall biosynthesis
LPHHQVFKTLPFYIKNKYRSIFKDAKLILPVSEHLGQALQKLNLIEQFQVIHNVVSDTFFYSSTQSKISTAAVRFLHVSSFDDAHKNISGMLSAFGKLDRDFILHIITEGNENEVWNLLNKYNVPKNKCVVEQQQTADGVGRAMRLADCFVLFSNYETFSVVLAEAWSSGLPAIYTQCGGLTEIKNPDLGIQLPLKDESALLKALATFEKTDYSPFLIAEYAKLFSIKEMQNVFYITYR